MIQAGTTIKYKSTPKLKYFPLENMAIGVEMELGSESLNSGLPPYGVDMYERANTLM